MSKQKRVVVLGSSFAGLTAAIELRKKLDKSVEVAVLDPRKVFTFIPSLIWLPFGLRDESQVTFDLATTYGKLGVRFINEAAGNVDLANRSVTTETGMQLDYDRLLVATGPRLAFEKVPGLGPESGFTQSICNLEHAEITRDAWQNFLKDPGPVVIGTAQGGSCFGASYEFTLNVRHQIEKAGLADVAPVTFVSAEPFLGHFGLGGVGDSEAKVKRMFAKKGIEGIPNSAIKQVTDGEMELESGRKLPFKFSMIVPPFTGVNVITQTEGLGNPMGWIPVDPQFRHVDHPEVFAAGVAVAITPPQQTPVPAGVPKTGQMSETMAKVAAANIAADLEGSPNHEMPMDEMPAICMLDGGNAGIIFKANNVLSTSGNRSAIATAGPHAHWAKIAFERFYLQTRKRGMTVL